MNEASIYLRQIKGVSDTLAREVARVPADSFNRRPGPHLNPVGWNYFHLLRIWDVDVNWLCKGQNRNEDAWHRGGFTETSGYNPDGKGTYGLGVGFGYSDEEVDEIGIDADVLRQYHAMLLAEIETYLGNASNDEMSRQAPTVLHPEQTKAVAEQIRHVIGHAYSHIGEMRYAMGVLGIHDSSYPGPTP